MLPQLSIIIPTLNEGQRISNTIHAIQKYLEGRSLDYQILIVDGASCDGTAEVLSSIAKKDPRISFTIEPVNRGKGDAVRKGMLAAKGKWRLYLDADLSTPIEELEKLMSPIQKGFDVVFGSRALPESELLIRQPWYRELPGRSFRYWVRFWTGLSFRDTQCGFKMFKAEAAERVFSKQRCLGFAFDVEALYLASISGLRVLEVPVRWAHAFPSKARVLQTGWKTFWHVTQIPRWHTPLPSGSGRAD